MTPEETHESRPVPVEDPLDAVLARCAKHVKSPEAIAAYERDVADARDREAREARAKKRRQLDTVGIAIRPAVLDAIVDGTVERTRSLGLVETWLRGPRPMLVLLGDLGVGKTVAAASVCAARIGRGTPVYVREPMLVRWSQYARHAQDWERACVTPTLVIDELGTANGRDLETARHVIRDLVDERLRIPRARTLLIGNLTDDAFTKRYDARTTDRLHEVGTFARVEGESMRRRPA